VEKEKEEKEKEEEEEEVKKRRNFRKISRAKTVENPK
jgi:hypothetical protein